MLRDTTLRRGARGCDVEARRLLDTRLSSVFPAPVRPILTATSQADASRIRRNVEGKGVSIQRWTIKPKIVEVDHFLRADGQSRFQESGVSPTQRRTPYPCPSGTRDDLVSHLCIGETRRR